MHLTKFRVGKRTLLASLISLALAPSAFAATISLSPETASGTVGAGTSPEQVGIAFGGDGTVAGFEAEVAFDAASLEVTVAGANGGSCAANNATGVVTVQYVDGGLNPIAAGPTVFCNMTFTVDGGVTEPMPGDPDVVFPLTIQNALYSDGTGNPAPGPHTETDGQIVIQGEEPEPPALVFDPNGGAIAIPAGAPGTAGSPSGTADIDITATGGAGAGTASYDCGVPAGFTVTNAAGSLGVGGAATMQVSCTLGISATSAPMACDVTDAGGDRTVNFTLNCPAGTPVPIAQYDDNVPPPGPGGVINCSGSPDSTTNRVLTISNDGIAGTGSDMTVTGCSAAGAGISIDASSLPATLAVGESVDVTVSCMIGPEDSAPLDGTVTCTSDAPNGTSVTYDVTGAPITTPPPLPAPDLIPANSLWSKLMLIGVFAGLGALVLALRRH